MLKKLISACLCAFLGLSGPSFAMESNPTSIEKTKEAQESKSESGDEKITVSNLATVLYFGWAGLALPPILIGTIVSSMLKKDRIRKLETKVKELKNQNKQLSQKSEVINNKVKLA